MPIPALDFKLRHARDRVGSNLKDDGEFIDPEDIKIGRAHV